MRSAILGTGGAGGYFGVRIAQAGVDKELRSQGQIHFRFCTPTTTRLDGI